MKISERQKDIKRCLTANPYFAGVPVLIEDDPEATPAEAAAAEKAFEAAVNKPGLVIVILSPYTARIDLAKKGAISLRVYLPVAVMENLEANRSAGGFGKPALEVVEKAMSVLLASYEFTEAPFGRPEIVNGLTGYFLQAETTHVVRAAS